MVMADTRKRPLWKPSAADFQRILGEQNPWLADGSVPDTLARKVERPLAMELWKRVLEDAPRRYQLILGPRRVGKTTCLYQTVRHLLHEGIPRRRVWWLRLDHPLLLSIPLGEWVRDLLKGTNATNEAPLYLFLDELAYASEWDLWLKTFYDEQWPVRIVGSSSSTAVLRDRRMESGVGRWEEQFMAPYLFLEFLDLIDQPIAVPEAETLASCIDRCIDADIDIGSLENARRRFLFTGGFPELLIETSQADMDEASLLLESQRTLKNDAIERAVYKDIPQAFSIDNPMLLERLLYTLAGQITGILSPTSLCRTLDGLSLPTFDRYVAYLERAFLIFRLQNYSGTEAARQKRGRKLYFVDAAVRNAALQRGVAPLSDPVEMGQLYENLAASHLHVLAQHAQVRLYYWRDGQHEVDLVFDHPTEPLAFEIAASTTHSQAGLLEFTRRFPRFAGKCYLVAPNATSMRASGSRDGIGSLPLDLFLLAVSQQAHNAMSARLGV